VFNGNLGKESPNDNVILKIGTILTLEMIIAWGTM
jgi:hypothetical protein